MVSVPAFLLRRLYVKGSLRNSATGFEFELRNRLGSGYAYGLWPLIVDGEEVEANETFFEYEGERTAFSDVSREKTFALAMNRSIKIDVTGVTLDDGPRKIGMAFDVPGLGTLRFDFTDIPADG
ncbi:MAG: hypothetical protein QGI88_14780 [SAR202 cluster bacterium]|nr:hypothetical protein [SAR202 cluster bacterium]